MQPQRMQHSARALHHTQDRNREEEPHVEEHDGHDDTEGAGGAKGIAKGHGPQHDGELLMGEGERPEAEVGSGVGDAVEAEFWGGVSVVLGFDRKCYR